MAELLKGNDENGTLKDWSLTRFHGAQAAIQLPIPQPLRVEQRGKDLSVLLSSTVTTIREWKRTPKESESRQGLLVAACRGTMCA